MLIIKPYGRSAADRTERTIRKINAEEITIPTLMEEDELAQWIGVIDKIIPKSKEAKKRKKGQENDKRQEKVNKDTQQLQENRKILGNAAWNYLCKKINSNIPI